jgi:AraC-like DNA-binding protein
MNAFPNTFNSSFFPVAQRQQAFARFCDNSPRSVLSGHTMTSLSSDSAEIHRANRWAGEDLFIATTRSTGYGITFERRKPDPGLGLPISVGLLRKGSCEFETGRAHHRLHAGDVYVSTLNANKFTIGESVATRMLFCDISALRAADSHGRLLVLQGSTPLGQLVASTIDAVEATLSSTGSLGAEDPLALVAKDISLRLLEGDGHTDNLSSQESTVERVRGFVVNNLSDTTLSPGRIADFLGMSRASLFRAFAGTGGVMAFVTSVRLEIARTMLNAPVNSRGRVNEVAFHCGFKSPAHFSTAFKEAFGQSPSEAIPSTSSVANR